MTEKYTSCTASTILARDAFDRRTSQTAGLGHLMGSVAALMLLASPVQAADYEVMGTLDVAIEPEQMQLWVPFDPAEDEAYARKIGQGVMATYTITAMDGTAGVATSFPRLSLSFMRPGPNVAALEMSYEPDFGIAYAADREIGDFSMQNVTIEGELMTFAFSGTVVELDTATYEPVKNANTIGISGMGKVTFRD